jgi:glycosyltransferase involved in cell wall biosynthesis
MRILYFSRDYTSHDHRFLLALAKTEHKVYFLQLERRGLTLEDRPLPAEIEQLFWLGGRTPARLRDGPRLLVDLKRVIRQVKPDLIQAGPLQRAAFLAALSGFRPLLSMSWGYDLLVDANHNAAWRWATRFTLKHSDAMVGDCQTIRQLAVTHGMLEERIVTFPWGIDLEHFSPLASTLSSCEGENVGNLDVLCSEAAQNIHISGFHSGIRSHLGEGENNDAPVPFVILSTRGWEPIYGVELIARAFVTAARQCPELKLIMLGNGSLAPMLHRIFAKGNIEEQVMFPGQVKYSELPRYYQMADLYVSATHSDGSSISLLEAMACGRPVLVSDIPGNREWVIPYASQHIKISASPLPSTLEEGDVGWLFPDGDADALAQAILHAVEQRRNLPDMGRRARALAEQRADWNKNFPNLFKAYDIALSRSN